MNRGLISNSSAVEPINNSIISRRKEGKRKKKGKKGEKRKRRRREKRKEKKGPLKI